MSGFASAGAAQYSLSGLAAGLGAGKGRAVQVESSAHVGRLICSLSPLLTYTAATVPVPVSVPLLLFVCAAAGCHPVCLGGTRALAAIMLACSTSSSAPSGVLSSCWLEVLEGVVIRTSHFW